MGFARRKKNNLIVFPRILGHFITNHAHRSRNMKLFLACTIIFMFCFINSNSQELSDNFKTFVINKKVREYTNKFDLGTPLNSYLTFTYLRINGKESLFRSASSYRIKGFLPKQNTPDAKITEEKKDRLLNSTIKEVIVYKNTIACVVSDYIDSLCLIRFMSLENGKWLNAGEDLGNGLTDARQIFIKKSSNFLTFLQKINELTRVSTDTISFINYLEDKGQEPKQFILNSLANHKLVIYGELHRRKASWDLWRNIIKEPIFNKTVGTVFLEISSDKQGELDRFFGGKKIESEIVLNIFREIQINGWYDKGMFEFIMDLWNLNKLLPEKRKIKVVAVDIPRPFNLLKSAEEYKNHFENVLDRNEQMANLIEQNIKSESGNRNYLFIVGLAHAYKSSVAGIASGKNSNKAKLTAAAQLTEWFPKDEVFSIFSHCPIISNDGIIHGKIRNGLFDYIFSQINNKPIGFDLCKSPFGAEPFDAVYEISYENQTGSFANNYDAYVFLGPIDNEPGEYVLYELFTDKFINELKRRAVISNSKVENWYNVKEVSKDAIISKLRNESEEGKRWENSF